MKNNKLYLILFLIISCLGFFWLLMYFFSINQSLENNFIDNWEYYWDRGNTLAIDDIENISWQKDDKLPNEPTGRQDADILWLRTKLPEKIDSATMIWFDRVYSSFELYVGNNIIYSFGVENKDPLRNFSGLRWLLTALKSEFGGKFLYVKIYSVYDYYIGISGKALIISTSDLLKYQFRINTLPVCFSFLFLIISFICLVLYLKKINIPGIANLGVITLLIGIYTLRYTKVSYYIIGDAFFWAILGAIVIFIIPFFYLKLIRNLFLNNKGKLLQWPMLIHRMFIGIGVGICIACIFFTNTYYGKNLLSLYLIIRMLFLVVLCFSIFSVILFLILEYRKKNKNSLYLLFGLINLTIFNIPDIFAAFGIFVHKFYSANYVGLFIVIITFVLVILNRYNKYNQVYNSSQKMLINQPNDFLNLIMEKHKFSKREQEVLLSVFKGLKNKIVAEKLYISERTVKSHLNNIFNKCGVNSKMELFYHLLLGNN